MKHLGEKKKVCIDCVNHILSKHGKCLECKVGWWQDESIVLVCPDEEEHGCRGWGDKCDDYEEKK